MTHWTFYQLFYYDVRIYQLCLFWYSWSSQLCGSKRSMRSWGLVVWPAHISIWFWLDWAPIPLLRSSCTCGEVWWLFCICSWHVGHIEGVSRTWLLDIWSLSKSRESGYSGWLGSLCNFSVPLLPKAKRSEGNKGSGLDMLRPKTKLRWRQNLHLCNINR